jgi:glycolate oxidase FAD binding subunit
LELFARQGGELVDPRDAHVLWQSVQEQTHSFFSEHVDGSLWRLSVPDTTPELHLPAIAQASDMMLEWGGALRWLKAPAAAAPAIRAAAAAVGGHATLFRADTSGDKDFGVFTPLAPALAKIHTQLLAQLDPLGVFNSRRLALESPIRLSSV